MTDTKPAMNTDKVLALVEAVQQEHGGNITNPKCPICIAINALLLTTHKAEYRPCQ